VACLVETAWQPGFVRTRWGPGAASCGVLVGWGDIRQHRLFMRALVTGGAGFIGSHVAEALVAQDWEVVVLDNLATGLASNVPMGAELVRGDAGDAALLARLLRGCQSVFHLAAVSSVQDSLERPLEVHGTNLTATLTLLEAAVKSGVRRFVFSSSAAIYGDTGGQLAREDMTPNPLSHYAVQKLAGEHYCATYRRLHGLETVCLRYFNVYGPRQRADSPYSGVIAKFADAARNGRPAVIFGDGGHTRDFVHVSDVVAANLAAGDVAANAVAGGVYNIGSGRSVSVDELASAVRRLFPGSPTPEHRPERQGEIRFSQADITMAGKFLGYRPSVEFQSGLERLINS
jgi:nucleoside-diphosphate-sugar epimerase